MIAENLRRKLAALICTPEVKEKYRGCKGEWGTYTTSECLIAELKEMGIPDYEAISLWWWHVINTSSMDKIAERCKMTTEELIKDTGLQYKIINGRRELVAPESVEYKIVKSMRNLTLNELIKVHSYVYDIRFANSNTKPRNTQKGTLKSLGMNLRMHRLRHGLTQRLLGTIMHYCTSLSYGQCTSAIIGYEHGKIPQANRLTALANILGLTPDELLEGTGYTFETLYRGKERHVRINDITRDEDTKMDEIYGMLSSISQANKLEILKFIEALSQNKEDKRNERK